MSTKPSGSDEDVSDGALRFDGKVVLVTGGSRGIGRAICGRFADAGARVFSCGRTVPDGQGPWEDFFGCDVRDSGAVRTMVDAIGDRTGTIDVLVNNAGGSPQVDAATVSPRFSESIIALNLTAAVHMSQAVHRWMVDAGGVIINIASVSAVRPSPGTAVYAAAKAGLLGLTRSRAQEWAPAIRVNAVIAGLIGTAGAETAYGSAQAAIAASLPAQRLGTGEDIASAVQFLASPMAAYVNGAELSVDGGGERPPFLKIVEEHGHG